LIKSKLGSWNTDLENRCLKRKSCMSDQKRQAPTMFSTSNFVQECAVLKPTRIQ
jgi:hypothetical protein